MMKEISLPKKHDVAIVIAFPDNWAKYHSKTSDWISKLGISSLKYYKVGHAALLLINGKSGIVEYFDFGRYTTGTNYGRVRSQETDPILKLPIEALYDSRGNICNIEEIITILDKNKQYTHGHGRIVYSICKSIHYHKAKNTIHKLIEKSIIKYSPFSKDASNCSRFVRDIIFESCTNPQTKKLLKKPATFTPTPMGNVVNSSGKTEIYQFHKNQFKTIHLTRRQELKQTIMNLLQSSFLYKSENLNKRYIDGLHAPLKHKSIPKNAFWLAGIGEGAWISIDNMKPQNNAYKIQKYGATGIMEYNIWAQLSTLGFQLTQSFILDYRSNRLITTVIQNNKKYVFKYIKDTSVYEDKKLIKVIH